MEQEKKSFSKFGKTFQEDLCHLILNDRTFADQMFEVLDLNFLELKHLKVFTRKIQEYRKKYGVHPILNAMTTVNPSIPNFFPAEYSPTSSTPKKIFKMYLSESSIIIVKMPAGKNGKPNRNTFFKILISNCAKFIL